ncbi:MAG: ectoine synthase [Patescibacteria group bacterium]
MIIKHLKNLPEDKVVNWGNGKSSRFLTKSDNLPFSVTKTIVNKGTTSKLQYLNHVEACYCISGKGSVRSKGESYEIVPDTLYIPENDEHELSASDEEDLVLMCVFFPALNGDERHKLSEDGYSTYQIE